MMPARAIRCGCRVTVRQPGQRVTVRESPQSVRITQPGTGGGGVPYAGPYAADALFSEQVFPTAMKTMRDDFTVRAINYTEAPNDSGVTVTIGG